MKKNKVMIILASIMIFSASNGLADNAATFRSLLESVGITKAEIPNVKQAGDTLTITVPATWHRDAYQNRLQLAQVLQQIWASVHSPSQPDKARIDLVDLKGNSVGGSRMWGGSLVWVKK